MFGNYGKCSIPRLEQCEEVTRVAGSKKSEKSLKSMGDGQGCCQVDAIVTIDQRGQIILPKRVREKAGVKPGDQLAVISCEYGGKVSCITFVKTDRFSDSAKDILSPMLQGMRK